MGDCLVPADHSTQTAAGLSPDNIFVSIPCLLLSSSLRLEPGSSALVPAWSQGSRGRGELEPE